MNKLPTQDKFEEWNFDFTYVRLSDLNIPREKWLNYLPDQTPHYALLGI